MLFAEDIASRRRISTLIPRGVIFHHSAHLADISDFPDPPTLILSQNKDRCVNRALFCADRSEKPCPVYVYADHFVRRRVRELGERGVTGLVALSWPDSFLKAALFDLLTQPDYEVTNYGEFGPLRLAS